MKFEKSDLLNYEKIESLLNSDSPNDRADIICEKLKKYCFIHNGNMYKYESTLVVYQIIEENPTNDLISIVTGYLTESKKNLNKEQLKILGLENKTEFKKLCENSTINKILPQLMTNLKDDEVRFNGDFYEIHYKNGYLDLKTLTFQQRIPNKHYVTNYIKRNYKPSTEVQRKEFLRRISKIYPVQEDLEAILYILGSAMTGKATKEQKILFLLGTGSNGKSTILKILKSCVGDYMETLEEEAFSVSNTNKDKTFSTFYGKPHIRIIWTNEPKADQMNVTTFKKFTEGEMKGKLLYKNGVYDFNHNALPVFSANFMPKIKIDGGVLRRFRGYIHKSLFVTSKEQVDESKNIYLTDRDLEDNIIKDDLLDAFIDILAVYANKWINGEEIPCPPSFQQSTDEMMESNDIIQDFIDAKIKITKSGEDRIGKNEMLKIFTTLFPKKLMDVQKLCDLLKAKGVKYDKGIRCPLTGIRGCFIGVQEKLTVDDDEEQKKNPLDHGLEIKEEQTNINKPNDLEAKNAELEQINLNLLKQIEELKAEMEKIKQSAVKLADGEVYNCYDEPKEELTADGLEAIYSCIMNTTKEATKETSSKSEKKNKSTKKIEE